MKGYIRKMYLGVSHFQGRFFRCLKGVLDPSEEAFGLSRLEFQRLCYFLPKRLQLQSFLFQSNFSTRRGSLGGFFVLSCPCRMAAAAAGAGLIKAKGGCKKAKEKGA